MNKEMVRLRMDIAVQKFIIGEYNLDENSLSEADKERYKSLKFMIDTLLKFYNNILIMVNELKEVEKDGKK